MSLFYGTVIVFSWKHKKPQWIVTTQGYRKEMLKLKEQILNIWENTLKKGQKSKAENLRHSRYSLQAIPGHRSQDISGLHANNKKMLK